MFRKICLFLLKLNGWKLDPSLPKEIRKCIVIAAPHTSNWDFWYMILSFGVYGLKVRFTVKKEWMVFPFKLIMQPLGGIAIDRTPRKDGNRPSFVDAMTDLFNQHEELRIVITPEGTRSKRTEWKTGFYYVATNAKVPILLGYVDYKTKTAGIGQTVIPTTYSETMKSIMDFYQTITPKYPDQFSVDTNY
jgi:1-acyl-sn-glycerol-3-phosphate acyltransferase